MSNMLSVTGIKNGTVIDHIAAGQALRIIHLLNLDHSDATVTIGLNLPSKMMGKKDLVKIEDRVLTEKEANEIVIFADAVTINVIENFKVARKINTRLPKEIYDIFICPNIACVTHKEFIQSRFCISKQTKSMKLSCHYCEKTYERDQMRVKI